MTRRAEKRAAKQVELLDTAMHIITSEGLEALTIARLAKDMGASVGGLYRYYPSKEAIIVALENRAIQSFSEWVRTELEAVNTAIASLRPQPSDANAALIRLIAGFEAYLKDAEAEPARHRLLDIFLSVPAPILSDEDAIAVNETLRPVIEYYSGLIEGAVKAGVLEAGDAAQRTYVIWAGVHGLDHFRNRDRILPENLQTKHIFVQFVTSTLRGWGAKPDQVRDAFASYADLPRPS